MFKCIPAKILITIWFVIVSWCALGIFSIDNVGAVVNNAELPAELDRAIRYAAKPKVSGNFGNALELFQKTIKDYPDSIYAALAYGFMGRMYQILENTTSAKQSYSEALLLFEKVASKSKKGELIYHWAHLGIFDVSRCLNKWKIALKSFPLTVGPEAESLFGRFVVGENYTKLAELYEKRSMWGEAISAHEKVLEYSMGTEKFKPALVLAAKEHAAIGECYRRLKVHAEAKKHYRMAISMYKQYLKEHPYDTGHTGKVVAREIEKLSSQVE